MILQTRPAVEILFELLKIQDGGWQIENVVLMDIINSLLNGNKTANINAKNYSLYTLLTATDRKPQKS